MKFKALTLLICSKLKEAVWDFQVREESTGRELIQVFTSRVCFPQRAATLQMFPSLLYFNKLIFDIWRSDLNFGALTAALQLYWPQSRSQRLISAAEVPLSHKWLDGDEIHVKLLSANRQLFRKEADQFLVLAFRQFAVDLLGFRRISSDWRLKDLLRPERVKKSFSSSPKHWQDCCLPRGFHMMVVISEPLHDSVW